MVNMKNYPVEEQNQITKVLIKTDLVDVKISQDNHLSWSMEHHCLMKSSLDQSLLVFDIESKEERHAEFKLNLPDELEEIRIETVSGDISIKEIKTDHFMLSSKSGDVKVKETKGLLWVKTLSGDIDVENCIADELVLNSSSGDIDVEINESKVVSIKSTSGEIEVDLSNAVSCVVNSTSGDIEFDGSAEHLVVKSKSGDVEVNCFEPKEIQIETQSGDVEMSVKACSGLEGVVQTNSGKIELDLEEAVFVSSALTWKDASAKIMLKTESGDISLFEE